MTYFHPLRVATEEGLLHGEAVRARAIANAKTRLQVDDAYKTTPVGAFVEREDALEAIRKQAEAGSDRTDPVQLKRVAEAIAAFEKLNPRPSASVKFLGFIESKVHYVYFCAMFFLLGHLLWANTEGIHLNPYFGLCSAPDTHWLRPCIKRLLLIALASAVTFCTWHALNFVRATVLGDYGRTVFSFVHADIGSRSYNWQCARSLLVCVLIGTSNVCFWQRFKTVSTYVAEWRFAPGDLSATTPGRILPERFHQRSSNVKDLFRSWQVHSGCLVGAFLPWMYYYWGLEDTRYYMSNLTLQVLWGITWVVITAPAVRAAVAFERYRGDLVAHLVNRETDKDMIDAAREEKAFSFLGVVGSGLTAVATYLVPVVHKVLT